MALVDVLKDQVLSVSFSADTTTNHPTPHWWLAQYGLTNFDVDVGTDIDLDGMAAWEEYRAGTDPTNRVSVFAILDAGTTGGTNFVTWYATTNSNVHTPFRIEYSTDPVNPSWTNLATVSRSPTGTNVWWWTPETNDLPAVIYRIQAGE